MKRTRGSSHSVHVQIHYYSSASYEVSGRSCASKLRRSERSCMKTAYINVSIKYRTPHDILTAMLLTSIYNHLTILLFSMIACQAAPTDNDTAVDYPNRIVLIRHGEKGFRPGDVQVRRALWPGPPGRFPSGLNDDGKKRAQWLRKVNIESFIRTMIDDQLFANGTEFDFGLIFAAPREAETKETERTYATVAPLAQDLGLDIDISW